MADGSTVVAKPGTAYSSSSPGFEARLSFVGFFFSFSDPFLSKFYCRFNSEPGLLNRLSVQ